MTDLFASVEALCEWCLDMGGRFHAHRECCQIRLLANAPRHQREQAYANFRAEGGALHEESIKRKVAVEYKRLNAARIAVARAALANIKNVINRT